MIYVAERGAGSAELAGASGIEPGHRLAPPTIELGRGRRPGRSARSLRSQTSASSRTCGPLAGRGRSRRTVADRRRPQAALCSHPAGRRDRPGRACSSSASTRSACSMTSYRGFLGLVAGQIAAAIANAQAYEEERRRAEALAELDRAKTAFFSNVSHEFRTPLTLMLGPIEDVLERSARRGCRAGHRGRLETAHRNSLRLLKLVNSLLDFSRIEAGRVDVSFEPVDLARLTARARVELRVGDARGPASPCGSTAPTLPEPVYVDRDMWEKIVLNLVVERLQVHLRGRDRGRAAQLVGSRRGGAHRPRHRRRHSAVASCRGCSSASTASRGRGAARSRAPASASRWFRSSSGCTAATIRAESEQGQGHGVHDLDALRLGASRRGTRSAGNARALSTSLRAGAFVEEALRWLPADASAGRDARRSAPTSPPNSRSRDGPPAPASWSPTTTPDMRDYLRRLLGSRWRGRDGCGRRGGARGDPRREGPIWCSPTS